MKKFVILLLILLSVSCKNHSNKYEFSTDDISVSNENETINKHTNTTETAAIPKLIEYLDLIKLSKQHPEFKEDILTQLQSLSKDSIIKLNYPNSFTIHNIRIENMAPISDSLDRVKLVYEIHLENEQKMDSIIAFISKKKIKIEGVNTLSTKVIFSN